MNNIPEDLPLYLGSKELPTHLDDGLTKGGIYSIQVESSPTRLCLMHQALYVNLSRGITCTLVTRLSLEEFLAYADQKKTDFFLNAIEEKKLLVFSMVGDYAKNLFRFGPERFLHELDLFGIPHDGFLVMDHADSLFAFEDDSVTVAQARIYRDWMQRTRNIALFFFLQVSDRQSHHAYFKNISDYFCGLARLYIGQNGLEIGIDFWSLQGAIVMAKNLAVSTGADGQIEMVPSLVVNRRHMRRPFKETLPESVHTFSGMPETTGGRMIDFLEATEANDGPAPKVAKCEYRRVHNHDVNSNKFFNAVQCQRASKKVSHRHQSKKLEFSNVNSGTGYSYRFHYTV